MNYFILIMSFLSFFSGVALKSQFYIRSNSFGDGEAIDVKYTCDGENISPHLAWQELPEGTKDLALIVDDPDAKPVAGKTFVHWIVINLPSEDKELLENMNVGNDFPDANELKNDYGVTKYKGPCPPSGTHTYRFTLFALKEFISLDKTLNADEFADKFKDKILGTARITGNYSRK